MLDIKDARKELKRAGCSGAEGDALRFMYANLLAFKLYLSTKANSISWPVPDLYAELGTVPDDKIRAKFMEIWESKVKLWAS